MKSDRKVVRLADRRWERATRKWQQLQERQDPGCVAAYSECERLMSRANRKFMNTWWRLTAKMLQKPPKKSAGLLPEDKIFLRLLSATLKTLTINQLVTRLKKLHAVGLIAIVADEDDELRLVPGPLLQGGLPPGGDDAA